MALPVLLFDLNVRYYSLGSEWMFVCERKKDSTTAYLLIRPFLFSRAHLITMDQQLFILLLVIYSFDGLKLTG
jgi:hypothetical protein